MLTDREKFLVNIASSLLSNSDKLKKFKYFGGQEPEFETPNKKEKTCETQSNT